MHPHTPYSANLWGNSFSLSIDCSREGAEDIVEAYLKKLGGRDAILDETTKASRGKKRGKPSGAASGTDTPASTKRSRKSAGHPADAPAPASSKPWSPPAGSWEDEIEEIQTEKDPTTSKLIVYLLWKNGKRTKHDTSVIYKKCPQKVRANHGEWMKQI